MSYKLYTIRDVYHQDLHQWSGRSLADELEVCSRRTLAALFERYLPRDGTIVEAGCGLGGWVKYLADRGYDVVGIDRDPQVVASAHRAEPGIGVKEGDILSLPFADGDLAAYISLGVIEHFEEGPHAALAEAFRALRPGGRVLITVPALSASRKLVVHPLRSAVMALLGAAGRKTYFGEYRYSVEELTAHVEAAGFRVLGTDLDEMVQDDPQGRHIGLYADMPIFRSARGAWRLNPMGAAAYRLSRLLPRGTVVNGYFIVAEKPSAR